jgi:hypothetical protein
VTEYTKPDGAVMEVHTFTATGTLTVDTPGYADVLVVSSGVPPYGGNTLGQGGRVRDGMVALPVGAIPVTVAAAAANQGNASVLGSIVAGAMDGPAGYVTRGAGAGRLTGTTADADIWKGVVSHITGTAVEYGAIQQTTPGSVNNGTVAAGVVIVAVQKSAPTISGVAATGGTVTEYTGDGVNGVLGQKYKVHTFTANGDFVVTQGGEADLLMCGGGSNPGSTYGNGAHIIIRPITLVPATMPVVIGQPGYPSLPSTFAGLLAAGAFASPADMGVGMGAGASSALAADVRKGIRSSITGTEVEYCKGAAATGSGDTPGSGGGQGGGSGAAGVVIVRYTVA